jgi:hypothetical protein
MRPLLRKVFATLAAVPIRERYLGPDRGEPKEGMWTYGQLEGRTILINPAVCIADTLVHEALHAVNPDYSENQVRKLAAELVRGMTHDEMRTMWEMYRAKTRGWS